MYISKLKSKIVAISDENIYNGKVLRVEKVTPTQLKEFLDKLCGEVEWISDLESNLITGDSKALALFDTFFHIDGIEKPDARYKLVRFPGNEIIRLCARGKMKKSYKNTLIVDDDVVKQFTKESTNKQPYVEIRGNKNKQKYDYWSDYISLYTEN